MYERNMKKMYAAAMNTMPYQSQNFSVGTSNMVSE
ncbi:hypothetical protein PF010_g29417 [Phytophthora fragariae]|uniref:Uncharacterized protein n=1 Tax=Phytophthora fragariae TaxID=53985 RepID=A0A6A4B4A6_9STRA|nr:hypothetical protein PF010_g29417 [Phytophthora fragariae]KAE9268856.1 hypothetical protein PF001_g29477 [Phytophthora fragariae]KAE9275780.1 hypothetical protein PF008_g29258 [Phytophthora fragariae]